MGFYSGRATFARYKVAGPPPKRFTEHHLARLAEHAAGRSRMLSGDGVESGWTAGDHVLDTEFDFAKNVINDHLFFCLRTDTLKLPSDLLRAYYDFWEPHTLTDPEARPMFEELRSMGLKVGVLSNTVWPREWHVGFFERDGVHDLIDGDVYTSEIPWTKPSPNAFGAAMEAVGVTDPAACVYVGDRLFDDVWGAQNAGMRAIHIPLSAIPATQVGHTEGTPDATVTSLAEIPEAVRALGSR